MRKAISAQNTKMYLEDTGAPSNAAGLLTNATRSNPCVAIFDSVANLINGGPVRINGTGWPTLDGNAFIVQGIDPETNSATLAGADTSHETETFGTAATYIVPAMIDICAVSYTITQTAAAEIDVTTLCDDEHSFLIGFTDPGSLSCEFFIDPTDPDYLSLVEAQRVGDERWFLIIYRNRAVRALPVIVQQVNESGGVDQAISGTVVFKVAGAPTLTMPSLEIVDGYSLLVITTPTGGAAPLEVTMLLQESGGTATDKSVTWGDGSAAESVSGTSATHTYTEEGSFTPSVEATVDEKAHTFKSQTTVTVTEGASA